MDRFHDKNHKMKGVISKDLEQNIAYLEAVFSDCNDIVKKKFYVGKKKHTGMYVIYTDGLAKADMIQENVLEPLLTDPLHPLKESVTSWVIESADRKMVTTMDEVVTAVLSGDTVLFFDGLDQGIFISSKFFPTRGVQEADMEVAMIGPKDSFNESLRTNTALIRRRVRDTRMKVVQLRIGTRSKTDVALMYIEDLAKDEVVKEIKKQLDELNIDGIFDSGMLEQLMEQDSKSPFPQYQLTQRPDKAASGLMEGRVVLVVDNSPEVIVLPVTLNIFFQASDDYYNRWEVATFARILRYISSFIAIGLPGFYISIANYHPEILPTPFMLSIVSAREGVPFPVVVEVLLLELAFELLREAGIRLPGQLGGTIGIVGGLIVGQAAVDANIVSTIVVIVVAFTAIASFSIPNESFSGVFRLLRFSIMIVCAIWGLYGFFLGFLAIAIHLMKLQSYGIPYLFPTVSATVEETDPWEDYMVRLPIRRMIFRPWFTKDGAKKRQGRRKHHVDGES